MSDNFLFDFILSQSNGGLNLTLHCMPTLYKRKAKPTAVGFRMILHTDFFFSLLAENYYSGLLANEMKPLLTSQMLGSFRAHTGGFESFTSNLFS